jgi:hypothetical protein
LSRHHTPLSFETPGHHCHVSRLFKEQLKRIVILKLEQVNWPDYV